jgi:hypothetical protein
MAFTLSRGGSGAEIHLHKSAEDHSQVTVHHLLLGQQLSGIDTTKTKKINECFNIFGSSHTKALTEISGAA